MATVEHRSNGNSVRKKHFTPAREAAELLFKKSSAEAPPEGSGENPKPTFTATPIQSKLTDPDSNRVSLSITDGSIFQAAFRLPAKMWESLGRPKRVDITGNPITGFSVIGGNMSAVQKGRSKGEAVCVSLSVKKVQLPPYKRFAIKLDAALQNGLVHISPPPKDWLKGADLSEEQLTAYVPELQVAESTEQVSPPVLETVDEEPTTPDQDDLGTIALRKNNAGVTLVFAVPGQLLVQLGAPARVLVTGKCQHGFIITPTAEGGVKLNYETGRNVYVSIGGSQIGVLTKEARKPFSVRMEIKDGALKVGGPNYEWIRGANQWLKHPPELPRVEHPALANTSIAPTYIQSGTPAPHAPAPRNGYNYTIPDNAGVPELRAHIGSLLAEFASAKKRLEEKTGMEFMLTKQLTLVVNLGMPNGFVAPSQQKEFPKNGGQH